VAQVAQEAALVEPVALVEWEELVDFVWDVLLHLDRDQVVTEIAEDTAEILDDE